MAETMRDKCEERHGSTRVEESTVRGLLQPTPDDYEEVVYSLEQKLLPIEEQDCTLCRGLKAVSKFRLAAAGYDYFEPASYVDGQMTPLYWCNECSGRGTRLAQLSGELKFPKVNQF